MKEIQLSQGKVAIVDDEDFERVNQFKWHVTKSGNNYYAIRNLYVNGKRTTQKMHRFIIDDLYNSMDTDHKNGDGLINTRENIRMCSHLQNGQNRKPNKNSSSEFKGVCWDKEASKWLCQIRVNKIKLYIGRFKSEIEAAKAYDKAAKHYFKEYSSINFNN